jgi:hypothetical protein
MISRFRDKLRHTAARAQVYSLLLGSHIALRSDFAGTVPRSFILRVLAVLRREAIGGLRVRQPAMGPVSWAR